MAVRLPDACGVSLPIPGASPYSYRVPPGLADRVVVGTRVVVPVRSREMVGIVVSTGFAEDEGLKSVLLAPDTVPLLSPALLELAEWMERYYGVSLGIVLKSIVPGSLWGRSSVQVELRDERASTGTTGRAIADFLSRRNGGATAAAIAKALGRPIWDALQRMERGGAVTLRTLAPNLGPAPATESVLVLTRSLPSLLERDQTFGRARRQREAYEAVDALGGEVDVSRLRGEMDFSRGVLKALVDRGLARMDARELVRDPFRDVSTPPPASPTAAQHEAIRQLDVLPAGGAATLFGVTGSGKTLVYLEMMRSEVERGRGAIVLVPEIALTPQTIARVRGVFGDTVAVLHSGLSDGERADAWRALAAGDKRVAVGARSAVFAPVKNLAVIVVDEEHDASYKNGEVPRYHARDVVLRRAKLEGARAVLGSATPSLEIWAVSDSVPVIRLPDRATSGPLPPVRLVDMRAAKQVEGCGSVPWSIELDEAVNTKLARREQVILLLNRRGFAHYVQCQDCGEVPECTACSIALTVHVTPPRLRCHYCDHQEPLPTVCPSCRGRTQRMRGTGTQSLEKWLTHRYPSARLARMDADTTVTKWSHSRILEEFGRGEVDILFGTQMIAKGLDFPGVTLVGVVNADTGLHLPDFRSAERTFQLIAQVAGRAGRGPKGGQVLVQTRLPHHYALQAAAQHDYEGFAAQELQERESPAYPPHVGLVNVLVSGTVEPEVSRGADDVAEWLKGLVRARDLDVEVLGPAPAPLARIKQRWRWHIVMRAGDRGVLGRVMRFAQERCPVVQGRRLRVVFDRDPVSLL